MQHSATTNCFCVLMHLDNALILEAYPLGSPSTPKSKTFGRQHGPA